MSVLFPGRLAETASTIRVLMTNAAYPFDCSPLLCPGEPDLDIKLSPDYRAGYMSFKHTVAKVIQPAKICEIGVGSGIAALAFLAACPRSEYFGIDDGSMTDCDGEPLINRAAKHFQEHEYNAHILMESSQDLDVIPRPTYDLIHVDGSHLREHTAHDIVLAWYALAPGGFILVDDARDTAVAAGTFDALHTLLPGSIDWTYFEDTYTGSILVGQEKSRP